MKKQKVVRSFGPGNKFGEEDLKKALENGWLFVRASEYVEGKNGYSGYIECILEKDEDSPKEEKLREELEALREKLNRARAEKEELEAYIEALKHTEDLQRKGTLKTLVMLTNVQRQTANRYETVYADIEGLYKWITEVKESLKAAISATEEEISEAAKEGGTEC